MANRCTATSSRKQNMMKSSSFVLVNERQTLASGIFGQERNGDGDCRQGGYLYVHGGSNVYHHPLAFFVVNLVSRLCLLPLDFSLIRLTTDWIDSLMPRYSRLRTNLRVMLTQSFLIVIRQLPRELFQFLTKVNIIPHRSACRCGNQSVLYRQVKTVEGGADAAVVSNHWAEGGAGAVELAQAVVDACEKPTDFKFLYTLDLSIKEKIEKIAKEIYGADGVTYEAEAEKKIELYTRQGFAGLPICMAKTHLSLSSDATKKGVPKGFTIPIRDVRASERDSRRELKASRIE
ncbi:formate-dihydrofolate ligase [Planoprotostelium fungivorum]|uniref:formate--tetrahydrofolate ligase n=1 Tax=Planoprotostelium fungivorum TaxID=1890364 RepID=A0A2P6MTE5_9EUKA|nr:formate-dihydrofolate ligase [Planoprotostelium fungivorum]